MRVTIKSKREIGLLREGGKILAEALLAVAERAKMADKEQISTKELDDLAMRIIRSYDAEPAFLGYPSGEEGEEFPAALCVSLNDEIVHGVPKATRILKPGDLVKLDLGVRYKKLCTDAAVSVIIGQGSKVAQRILEVTKKSLDMGIDQMYPGSKLGNYGNAVEKYIKMNGFAVIKRLVGHGVGYDVHEDPLIPNYGKAGEGMRLKEGMVLALEPMVSERSEEIISGDNPFVYKTEDGDLAGHFEHTIAITEDGCEVLTLPD